MQRFTVSVPQTVLDDLSARLQRTRLPGAPVEAAWHYGANPTYMRGVLDHWRDRYDWRAAERGLNRWPQFSAVVEGQRLHFLHLKGSGANTIPLLLIHGWPGSHYEFFDVIELLTHPERCGLAGAQAFDIVIPSLPGYGFSEAPPTPIDTRAIAGRLQLLMTGVLGYPRYLAQGGDWGSLIASWLGIDHADSLIGVHLNMIGLRPPFDTPPSAEEKTWMAQSASHLDREGAYMRLHGTKHQTLAYALSDSPLGLAAWILEKFHGWTSPRADMPPFALDRLLTNVMIYWVTNAMHSSMWLYRATRDNKTSAMGKDERCEVPTGFALYPNDLFKPPPMSFLTRGYNVVHRTDMDHGGHFAAFEDGPRLVADLRDFVAKL